MAPSRTCCKFFLAKEIKREGARERERERECTLGQVKLYCSRAHRDAKCSNSHGIFHRSWLVSSAGVATSRTRKVTIKSEFVICEDEKKDGFMSRVTRAIRENCYLICARATICFIQFFLFSVLLWKNKFVNL